MRFKRFFLLFGSFFLLASCGINPADYEDSSSKRSTSHVHNYYTVAEFGGDDAYRDYVKVMRCNGCGDTYYEYESGAGYNIYYFTEQNGTTGEQYAAAMGVTIAYPDQFNGNIVVPDTIYNVPVTEIRDNCFNSPFIKNITIGSYVRTISQSAFDGAPNLEWITVKTSNPYFTTSTCGGLYSKDLGECVRIPQRMYKRVDESIEIDPLCYNIRPGACKNVTAYTFVFHDYLYSIGEYAFENCYRLNRLDFTDASNLNSIGSCAFKNCYNLYEVRLNSSLGYIEYAAFENCYNLVELYNYSSLTIDIKYDYSDYLSHQGGIGKYVEFYHDHDYMSGHVDYVYSGAYTYYVSGSNFYILGVYEARTMPRGIVLSDSGYQYHIRPYAFYYAEGLESINVMYNNLYSVGYYAFAYSDLEYFDIGSNLNSVGSLAFYNCSKLYSVSMPSLSKLDSLGISSPVFGECHRLVRVKTNNYLDNISQYIGNASIYGGLFAHALVAGCYINEVKEEGNMTYIHTDSGIALIRLDLNFDASKRIDIGHEFYRILPYAFSGRVDNGQPVEGYTNTVDVRFNEYVDYIDENAFLGCSLSSLRFDKVVGTIIPSAFNNSFMNNITFYSSVNNIQGYAFNNATIGFIDFDQQIYNLEDFAFANVIYCKHLHFDFSNFVDRGNRIFRYSRFEEIKLPNGITYIDNHLFDEVNAVARLWIPTTLDEIDDDAFSYNVRWVCYDGNIVNNPALNLFRSDHHEVQFASRSETKQSSGASNYWRYTTENRMELWNEPNYSFCFA